MKRHHFLFLECLLSLFIFAALVVYPAFMLANLPIQDITHRIAERLP